MFHVRLPKSTIWTSEEIGAIKGFAPMQRAFAVIINLQQKKKLQKLDVCTQWLNCFARQGR